MASAIRAGAEAVRVEPQAEVQSSTRYAAAGGLRRIDFAKGSLMPIFEYKCAKCGHVMEVLLKSRTGATPTCEKCGGADLKKLLSGFAVGKAASPACDSCFEGPACGGACPGGTCPMS